MARRRREVEDIGEGGGRIITKDGVDFIQSINLRVKRSVEVVFTFDSRRGGVITIYGVDLLYCIGSVRHGLSICFEFVLIFGPLSLDGFNKTDLLCESLEINRICATVTSCNGAVTPFNQIS